MVCFDNVKVMCVRILPFLNNATRFSNKKDILYEKIITSMIVIFVRSSESASINRKSFLRHFPEKFNFLSSPDLNHFKSNELFNLRDLSMNYY